MNKIRYLIFYSGWLVTGTCFHLAQAAPTAFTIDSSQSQILVFSPPSVFANFAMTPQGTGALGTSYGGSLNVNLAGSTIQFTGGSSLNAQTNGVWQPAIGGAAGSAPADYGAEASVNYFPHGFVTFSNALRNIVFDVTSPALPLTTTNFNGTNLVFSFASANASLDYYSSYVHGSVVLNGYATNTVGGAFLTTNAGTETLSIPIAAQFVFSVLSPDDTKVFFFGQLVATNAITAAAPLIESITVTNQSAVVAAKNVTGQSQLLVSTNLTAWSPATVTTTTNNLGWIIFTAPMHGAREFFRVQQ